MKTKEEIIEQEFHNHTASNLADFEIRFMKNSMEIYAKQEAIAFQNFLIDQRWFYHWYLNLYTKETIDSLEIAKAQGKTIEEIHELFQQSKTTKTPSQQTDNQ